MRLRIKKWLLPASLGLALLLLSSFVVYDKFIEPFFNKPTQSTQFLTERQVISLVWIHGVPYFRADNRTGSPVGNWAAVYQGNNTWKIRGSIIIRGDYYLTTWLYNGDKITLAEWRYNSSFSPPLLPTKIKVNPFWE